MLTGLPAFLLIDQKKSLAKEKSPAGDKLPEIQSNGGKNCNEKVVGKFSHVSLPAILAYRHYSEFLIGNLSQAGYSVTSYEFQITNSFFKIENA